MGGVFDDLQAVIAGQGAQRVHVGQLPVQMHRHQRTDAAAGDAVEQPAIAAHTLLLEEAAHRCRRQVVGGRVDVQEDRPGAGAGNRAAGGKEGVGRGDDLIARADVQGHECQQQCVGA